MIMVVDVEVVIVVVVVVMMMMMTTISSIMSAAGGCCCCERTVNCAARTAFDKINCVMDKSRGEERFERLGNCFDTARQSNDDRISDCACYGAR
jgi:hypothetical protein